MKKRIIVRSSKDNSVKAVLGSLSLQLDDKDDDNLPKEFGNKLVPKAVNITSSGSITIPTEAYYALDGVVTGSVGIKAAPPPVHKAYVEKEEYDRLATSFWDTFNRVSQLECKLQQLTGGNQMYAPQGMNPRMDEFQRRLDVVENCRISMLEQKLEYGPNSIVSQLKEVRGAAYRPFW